MVEDDEFSTITHIDGVFLIPILLMIAAYLPCLFFKKLLRFLTGYGSVIYLELLKLEFENVLLRLYAY